MIAMPTMMTSLSSRRVKFSWCSTSGRTTRTGWKALSRVTRHGVECFPLASCIFYPIRSTLMWCMFMVDFNFTQYSNIYSTQLMRSWWTTRQNWRSLCANWKDSIISKLLNSKSWEKLRKIDLIYCANGVEHWDAEPAFSLVFKQNTPPPLSIFLTLYLSLLVWTSNDLIN